MHLQIQTGQAGDEIRLVQLDWVWGSARAAAGAVGRDCCPSPSKLPTVRVQAVGGRHVGNSPAGSWRCRSSTTRPSCPSPSFPTHPAASTPTYQWPTSAVCTNMMFFHPSKSPSRPSTAVAVSSTVRLALPLSPSEPALTHPPIGAKGMVACSQPLAAEAGLEILRKGGNAAEAGEPPPRANDEPR